MIKVDGSIQIDNTEDMLFTYDEQEKQDIEIAKANSQLVFSPKYIIIQPIWLKELSLIQAYIFGFIDYYLGQEGKRFYFTNEQLANICSCGERTVQDSIQALEKLGYIKTSRKVRAGGGQIRFVDLGFTTSKICQSDTQKATSLTSKKLPTNNNYINKKYINTHSLSSNEDNSFVNSEITNNNISINNNDVVILDNKEESFVKLNNKDTGLLNNNCKVKENKIKESPFDANEVFDKLWNFYPGKKNAKEAARTYFKKKIKTQYDLDLLRYALPLYISTVNDKNYLVLLRTYLSEERYKDYEQQFKNINKPLEKETLQETNEGFKLKFNRTYEN